jgi:trigger factor
MIPMDEKDFIIAVKRSKARVVATVTVQDAVRKKAEEKALDTLSAAVSAPGFRPGKVPRNVAKEKIGDTRIVEETVRTLLPGIVTTIATDNDVKPILSPSIEIIKTEPLELRITFIERPSVALKGADKITIPKEESKVDAKDVDRVIASFLKEEEKESPVERDARHGDSVMTDFSARDEAGNAIAGTNATDYRILLGSNTLIPGFEEGLIGIKKGETRSLNLTFPKEYHAEHLQGKKATFSVTAKQVNEVTHPELTAELLTKKLGRAVTPEAFRAEVHESLASQEAHFIKNRREGLLFDAIRKATTVEIPDELLQAELSSMIENLERNLRERNMTLEEWLTRTKKKGEEVRDEMKKQALDRLTLRFGLEKFICNSIRECVGRYFRSSYELFNHYFRACITEYFLH